MLIEIIALIISYFGVFVGFELSKIAKEEVIAGKKNLASLEWALRLFILIMFFALTDFGLLSFVLIMVLIVIIESIFKDNYSWLGLLFGLNPDFLIGSLIFVYGLPRGSLMLEKSYLSILKKTIVFVIIGVIVLFVRKYLLI